MLNYFPVLKHFNIPNLITSLGLGFGFLSFILIINQHIRLALTLYLLVILLDRIDGFVARKLDLTSDFGKQLDTLADAFNFCLFPALTAAYLFGFEYWWMLVFGGYILSGIWRLAHYNLIGTNEVNGIEYFSGIPTTLVGAWFLMLMSFHPIITPHLLITGLVVLFIVSAGLMLSSVRYAKEGWITQFTTVLTPVSVIMMWLY